MNHLGRDFESLLSIACLALTSAFGSTSAAVAAPLAECPASDDPPISLFFDTPSAADLPAAAQHEDFQAAPPPVLPLGCDEPLSSTNGGGCFSSPLAGGFEILTAEQTSLGCQALDCPLVLLHEAGDLAVGANRFSHSTRVRFTTGHTHVASLRLLNLGQPTGGWRLFVRLGNGNGPRLGPFDLPASGQRGFFAIVARQQSIHDIEVAALNDGGELITELRFGGGSDLAVTLKAEPATLQVGDPLTWRATLRQRDSAIHAEIPTRIRLSLKLPRLPQAAQIPAGSSCCQVAGERRLLCELDQLPSQPLAFLVAATEPGEQTGSAEVSALHHDPDLSNNSSMATARVLQPAGLSFVQRLDSATVLAGQAVQAELVIANLGERPAEQVKVRLLPHPALAISATSCPLDASSTWRLESLEPGMRSTCQIALQVDPETLAGSLTVRSEASAAGIPPLARSSSLRLRRAADLALALSSSVIGPLLPGSELGLRLRVDNLGPLSAHRLEVVLHLPEGLEYVEDSCGGEFDPPRWRWQPPTVPLLGTVSCLLHAKIRGALGTTELLTAVAEVEASEPDPVTANNLRRLAIEVAGLTLDKSCSPLLDTALWRCLLTVTRPPSTALVSLPLPKLEVIDFLPTDLDYVSDSCNAGPPMGGSLSWKVGVLPAAGDSIICALDLRPTAAATGLLINRAELIGAGLETLHAEAPIRLEPLAIPTLGRLTASLLVILLAGAGWYRLRRS